MTDLQSKVELRAGLKQHREGDGGQQGWGQEDLPVPLMSHPRELARQPGAGGAWGGEQGEGDRGMSISLPSSSKLLLQKPGSLRSQGSSRCGSGWPHALSPAQRAQTSPEGCPAASRVAGSRASKMVPVPGQPCGSAGCQQEGGRLAAVRSRYLARHSLRGCTAQP